MFGRKSEEHPLIPSTQIEAIERRLEVLEKFREQHECSHPLEARGFFLSYAYMPSRWVEECKICSKRLSEFNTEEDMLNARIESLEIKRKELIKQREDFHRKEEQAHDR